MEKKGLLEQINSKYIINNIFEYIKDDIIKFQLFKYSKFFKSFLNLDTFGYQRKYFEKIKINFFEYLSEFNENEAHFYPKKFQKESLVNKLKKDLLYINLDIKIIEDFIGKYFELYDYSKDDNIKYIDIYSPFFDILLKTKIFDKFILPISVKFIEENNLKNDYIFALNKLNNLNYNLFLYCENQNDINYIKDLKINFNNIKVLKCIISEENTNNILKSLFSLNNFGDNLIELDIKINGTSKIDFMYNFDNYASRMRKQ